MNYVQRQAGVDTYTTMTDTMNIKSQTDTRVNQFWNVIGNDSQRDLGNETSTFLSQPGKPLFNTSFWLTQIAVAATVKALSSATVSKARQIIGQVKPKFTSAGTPTPLPGAADEPDPDDASQPTDDTGKPRFVFTWHATLDDKTCHVLPDGSEGCAPRDGKEYFNDDPDLIEPPDETHPNCRCYIEVELLEYEIKNITSPPQKKKTK
jgi:hypothetical protein